MTTKQMQWQLFFLGFYGGKIDGITGDLTIKAIKKFQTGFNMVATGEWSSATENKSVEIIKDIQEFLNKEIGSNLVVDGLAGSLTKIATSRYQQKVGLDADGIAGTKTRAKIENDKKEFSTTTTTTTTVNTNSTSNKQNATGTFWDGIKYFDRSEFACKCGRKYCNGYPVEPNQQLVKFAENVRTHFGKPMTVSSGIRCTRHNANVGGVSNSRHLSGKAMDFCVSGKSAAQVLAYVNTLSGIRYAYAINSSYVHMDVA